MEIVKINNIRQIRAEDFSDDLQEDMGRLGGVINPFMQEVFELADKRVGFENLEFVFKQIDISVDDEGISTKVKQINTGKSKVNGIIVIRAYNLTNAKKFPTQMPWINIEEEGSGVVNIVDIKGLTANDTYRLNLVIF